MSGKRQREFITLLGGVATWPLAARAQRGERVRRIGVLVILPKNYQGLACECGDAIL